jgi:hypothetical protein
MTGFRAVALADQLLGGARLGCSSRPSRAPSAAARRRSTLSTITAQLHTEPASSSSNTNLTTTSAFSNSAMTDNEAAGSRQDYPSSAMAKRAERGGRHHIAAEHDLQRRRRRARDRWSCRSLFGPQSRGYLPSRSSAALISAGRPRS